MKTLMDASPVVKGEIRINPFVEFIHYFWEFLFKCLVIKNWSSNSWKRAIIPSTSSVVLALGFSGGKPLASPSDRLNSLLSWFATRATMISLVKPWIPFTGLQTCKVIGKINVFQINNIANTFCLIFVLKVCSLKSKSDSIKSIGTAVLTVTWNQKNEKENYR